MNTAAVDTKMMSFGGAKTRTFLVDTTLRDGEQSPGVVFSRADKRSILRSIIDIGIRDVEIGIPVMGEDEGREIGRLAAYGRMRGARMIAWSRARREDIDACQATGAEVIHMALPTSDIQMRCIRKDRGSILKALEASLEYARGRLACLSVGAQDATRADSGFLEAYIAAAVGHGAHRIRLSDTVGVGNPMAIFQMVSGLKDRYPSVEWEFHAHDDFGMATANSLTALQAGAHCVSTTVLGIGERAGNAALEQVVMGAKHLCGIDLGVDSTRLVPLCETVARASGRAISSTRPVCGAGVLLHESGIHTQGQLVSPFGFQPFSAADLGREEAAFVFGKHSGRAAVRAVLARQHRCVPDDLVARVTVHI